MMDTMQEAFSKGFEDGMDQGLEKEGQAGKAVAGTLGALGLGAGLGGLARYHNYPSGEVMAATDNPREKQDVQNKAQEIAQQHFTMRHPFATGAMTMGIAPAIGRDRAEDELSGALARNYDDLMDAVQRANELKRTKAETAQRRREGARAMIEALGDE